MVKTKKVAIEALDYQEEVILSETEPELIKILMTEEDLDNRSLEMIQKTPPDKELDLSQIGVAISLIEKVIGLTNDKIDQLVVIYDQVLTEVRINHKKQALSENLVKNQTEESLKIRDVQHLLNLVMVKNQIRANLKARDDHQALDLSLRNGTKRKFPTKRVAPIANEKTLNKLKNKPRRKRKSLFVEERELLQELKRREREDLPKREDKIRSNLRNWEDMQHKTETAMAKRIRTVKIKNQTLIDLDPTIEEEILKVKRTIGDIIELKNTLEVTTPNTMTGLLSIDLNMKIMIHHTLEIITALIMVLHTIRDIMGHLKCSKFLEC
jgi:hypothetical protein